MRLGPQARRWLRCALPSSLRRASQPLHLLQAGWQPGVAPSRLQATFAMVTGLVTLCLASGGAAETASRSADAHLLEARFAVPTTHYPHGVLGDRIEYSAMTLRDSQGRVFRIDLRSRGPVFEDLSPRLWDVTADGAPEAVVVESDPEKGAQLAVYGLQDGAVRKIAATPHIGTRFRWLAPIAAADLDGDGHIEVAYIDRPHLAKTLRVWRYRDGKLHELAQAGGLTNHRIGEDFITSGLRRCGDKPELITVDAGWARIMATAFEAGELVSRDIGAFSRAHGLAAALQCNDPE
ncbi:FG-GAP repeat domain-containing protein [Phaeobacter sp. C3_T13_0]|uniref:FG-GAP repeat domain-containing protein n=1 Tax=Phaeobacter cretensis TaxID=3342641 RepID=UPI0039BD001B